MKDSNTIILTAFVFTIWASVFSRKKLDLAAMDDA